MALAIEAKRQILSTNQRHKTDTGSPEVQIALLSQRISLLTEHFKTHNKDHGSRKVIVLVTGEWQPEALDRVGNETRGPIIAPRFFKGVENHRQIMPGEIGH